VTYTLRPQGERIDLPEIGSEEASRLAKAAARAFVAPPDLKPGPELDDAVATLARFGAFLTMLAAELEAASAEEAQQP
jgi:hypothetical protein